VLHGWFLPAQGKSRGTVLFLHGNAQNISTHIGSVYWLPHEHFNVFLFDYRGYGESEGVPTIPGLIDDFKNALDVVLQRPDVDPDKIIVFGQSLGGSIAIYGVAHSPEKNHIKALIVESAFADYRKIAQEKLADFWLTWALQWPLSWLFAPGYSPLNAVALVSPVPLLIIHGDADRVVPVHHARWLYAAASEPKTLWILPGGRHIGGVSNPEFRQRLVHYMLSKLAPNSHRNLLGNNLHDCSTSCIPAVVRPPKALSSGTGMCRLRSEGCNLHGVLPTGSSTDCKYAVQGCTNVAEGMDAESDCLRRPPVRAP
jgi:fermentation-respiration switch protein FrsA (DUF1100 family)